MKFCDKCENMYYIGINADENTLKYYCRHCGNADESIGEEGVCVLNTQYKQKEQKFNHIINQYTKLFFYGSYIISLHKNLRGWLSKVFLISI